MWLLTLSGTDLLVKQQAHLIATLSFPSAFEQNSPVDEKAKKKK